LEALVQVVDPFPCGLELLTRVRVVQPILGAEELKIYGLDLLHDRLTIVDTSLPLLRILPHLLGHLNHLVSGFVHIHVRNCKIKSNNVEKS